MSASEIAIAIVFMPENAAHAGPCTAAAPLSPTHAAELFRRSRPFFGRVVAEHDGRRMKSTITSSGAIEKMRVGRERRACRGEVRFDHADHDYDSRPRISVSLWPLPYYGYLSASGSSTARVAASRNWSRRRRGGGSPPRCGRRIPR